jgi:hypothetical protein
MPKSMTMLRAISVARSRSFCAPVEMSEDDLFGNRAGQQHLDAAFQLDCVIRKRSPSGRCIV